ncbi:MAG: alpha/beta hydrolase family protein [Myxococcota bacterium]
MTNLDDIAGRIVRIPQLLGSRPRNTIERLGAYDGRSLAELFPEPAKLPAVRARRRWALPGFESEDLVFDSLYEPIEPQFARHYHERRRRIQTVYAKRVRVRGAAERPRLIYIHGYMQPETPIEEVALVTTMARMLDVEVIQVQPPYHGRRKPRSSRYSGERYWTADVVRSFEALRQSLFDARTLLSFLKDERDGPVGIAGLSLGGSLSAMLTCLEPGFDFSVPLIAHMDMGALVRDAPVLQTMRENLRRFGWTPADFGAFFTRLGWDELRPAIPLNRIMLLAARDDRFFPALDVEAMWRLWGEPEIRWYPTSHMGFIPHLPGAFGELRRFISEA